MKYWAFISYSSRDGRWGEWLHRALERYRVPKGLVGRATTRGEAVPARIFPIFRDRDELPTDTDLSVAINGALEQSRYLILICSPHSAQSRWVNKEILEFKRLGRENRVLAVIIDGIPNATDGRADPALECFPPALRFKLGADGSLSTERTEPIAADARPHADGKQNALLKLLAGVLGVNFDDLKRRDEERRRKQQRLVVSVSAALVLLFAALAGAAIWQWRVAEARRKEALKTASATDFAIADLKHQGGDIPAALAYLAQSLQNDRTNFGAASLLVSLCRNLPYPVRSLPHSSNVYAASYSPDGKWIVTACWDHTVQVWDTSTGKPTGKPMRHDDIVFDANFSPDGKSIVTASNDKTARIWDAFTGQPTGDPMRHNDSVRSATFSPDGKRIVTASSDKTVRIWAAGTGKELGQPLQGEFGFWSAKFSPDGKMIVTASGGGARIWDAETGEAAGATFHGDETDNILSASFSPDGKRIVTSSTDKLTQVWEVQTRQPVGKPIRHLSVVWTASFSPDGKRIVTASWDNTAQVWDAETGDAIGEPMRHQAWVFAASFSPDGRWIATASKDNTARIWDAQTLKTVGEPMCSDGASLETNASFSPDGKWVATVTGDKTLRVWDPLTGKLVGEPVPHQEDISEANFSADGKWVVTAAGNEARVSNTQTGKPVGKPMQHDDAVLTACFSPDGARILTASKDGAARIWDVLTGKTAGEALHQDNLKAASFSPDGKWIMTVSTDQVRVWDAQTAKARGEPMRDDDIIAASMSPDGTRIVTALGSAAQIWDARTGKKAGIAMPHDLAVMSANFSPDGTRIVTASNDKTARIWDGLTGRPLTGPMPHKESLATASFSPDGKWVVSAATYENIVRVWEARTGKEVDELPGLWDANITCATFSPDGKWILTGAAMKARVWEADVVANDAPDWLLALAEAIGQRHLNANGVLEPHGPDVPRLRDELRDLKGDDELSRFARWFVAEPATRTISPRSSISVSEFVSQRLRENDSQGIEEAYRIDPGNPLVIASVAKFENDKDEALFLCRHALRRALIEGPAEKVEQVRSIARSLFPGAPEFSSRTSGARP